MRKVEVDEDRKKAGPSGQKLAKCCISGARVVGMAASEPHHN